VSEGKAEEALQSAVCNTSQTLALGLGFGRFESWREIHETCKNANNAARDAGKSETCFEAGGDGGQILYLCIRGQAVQVLAAGCWLLAAVTKFFWRLWCLFGTRYHTSPGLQIPGIQRFLVKPLPRFCPMWMMTASAKSIPVWACQTWLV
jgi:hypothetical protein